MTNTESSEMTKGQSLRPVCLALTVSHTAKRIYRNGSQQFLHNDITKHMNTLCLQCGQILNFDLILIVIYFKYTTGMI